MRKRFKNTLNNLEILINIDGSVLLRLRNNTAHKNLHTQANTPTLAISAKTITTTIWQIKKQVILVDFMALLLQEGNILILNLISKKQWQRLYKMTIKKIFLGWR
ncbi:hypothetical protein BBW65_05735 [Helicobacter enhydrae]|uniref:Uncharacterized protein n=1 Tax=Helicobacter enhydrae TaxID=222136 RepID=A0A1B1U6F8_9HELI|nr:hypothetical protein [Helicobacter enhydrae]ANV98330.1 hypothetical protein BBW65_05735 [Helicobacter enhydrae]